jgi:uncharacterized protein
MQVRQLYASAMVGLTSDEMGRIARLMSTRQIKLRQLPGSYSICRLSSASSIPDWAQGSGFVAIVRSAEEVSIVCMSDGVPNDVIASRSWCCLQFIGPFAFDETGVVLSVIRPISENKIGIFIISTFDTDYLLIQNRDIDLAKELLRQAGHEFI